MRHLIVSTLKKQANKNSRYFFLTDKEYDQYIDELYDLYPFMVNTQMVRKSFGSLGEGGVILPPNQGTVPCLFYRGLPVFRKRDKEMIENIYKDIE